MHDAYISVEGQFINPLETTEEKLIFHLILSGGAQYESFPIITTNTANPSDLLNGKWFHLNVEANLNAVTVDVYVP